MHLRQSYTAHRLFVFIETNAKMIPIGESNSGKNTGIPCHGIDITPVKKLIIKIAEIIGIVIKKIAGSFSNIHIESKSPFSLKL